MKHLYIYSLIIACLFFSCEKSLDLKPLDRFSESNYFKNAEQFKLFCNQFYNNFPTANSALQRDLYSDLFVDWSTNSISNGSYSAPTSNSIWNNSYAIIRNTCYLIERAEESSENLKSEISVYVGEANYFRAVAYFDLLKDFGGVPLIEKVLDVTDVDELYKGRATREEIVIAILKYLDTAIEFLPLEKDISKEDKGRVSKEAALSMKARVCLFEGTWQKFRGKEFKSLLEKAVASSKEVIDGNYYKLFDRRDVLGDQSYKYFFILDKVKSNVANLTKADQNEYILANRFDTEIRPANVVSSHRYPSVTKKFADMFLCDDGLPIDKSKNFKGRTTVTSEYENRDLRMTSVLQLPFTKYWAHFPPEYSRDFNNPDDGGNNYTVNFDNTSQTGYFATKFRPEIREPYSPDFPVIRFAEVLLIYAEAKFEIEERISDEDLDLSINKLRRRAGLPVLSNSFVQINRLDMRTEIRRERTIELFLEGFRFDDLRRWKTAEIEMPQALKGVLWKDTQYETDPQWSSVHFQQDEDGFIIIESASKRKFEEKHYLFPIPTRQIILNSNLEQNPGW